ncbi:MAG TPA: FliG C-terminal domain-containing protein [Pirellulales bacterium]|nr:FliG C-terminal domain-containing protein [Pirellulales bacterium]
MHAYRQAPPAARAVAGALIVVALVVLGIRYAGEHHASTNYLFGGQDLSIAEISAMEAAFGKANLNDYVVEGRRLSVPRAQQAAYMAALADHAALPANFGDYMTRAMLQANPFTSRAQQEEMIKNAKQRELAMIVCAMRGIDKAAVHYDTNRTGGLRSTVVATASVSVKPQGTQTLDEKQVHAIRHLVASAIAGLAPSAVTVIDLNGCAYSAGDEGPVPGADDPYLARVREYQAMYETMIHSALSYVPGVTVTVNVELDAQPAGSESANAAATQPRRVAASVGVPSTYFETICRRQSSGGPPDRNLLVRVEQEETEKIRAHVARLLPETADAAERTSPRVTVTPFSQAAPAGAPSASGTASTDSQLERTRIIIGAMLAVVICIAGGCWALRPLLRPSSPTAALDVELQGSVEGTAAATMAAEENATPSEPFRFLRQSGRQNLLALLDGEHPQAIALVLAHLPPEQASEVLAALPATVQGEIVERLVDLNDTAPEILKEVEQGLQSRIVELLSTQRRRAVGLASATSILQSLDAPRRNAILSTVARQDAALAGRLGLERPEFTDLNKLTDDALAEVLALASPEVVRLATASASPPLAARILASLPADQAATLRQEVVRLGPTRLSDVERAQDELAQLAARLGSEGRVVLPTRRTTATAA